MRVCVDSNVFIAIENKEEDAEACATIVDAIEQEKLEGVISAIVLSEVEVGFFTNKALPDATEFEAKILDKYIFVPVSADIAMAGASLRAATGMKLPDSLIVASATATACDFIISTDIPVLKKTGYTVVDPSAFCADHLVLEENPAGGT